MCGHEKVMSDVAFRFVFLCTCFLYSHMHAVRKKSVIFPVSFFDFTIWSDFLWVAIEFVVAHLALLHTSIIPKVQAITIVLAIFPLTAEYYIIALKLDSFTLKSILALCCYCDSFLFFVYLIVNAFFCSAQELTVFICNTVLTDHEIDDLLTEDLDKLISCLNVFV